MLGVVSGLLRCFFVQCDGCDDPDKSQPSRLAVWPCDDGRIRYGAYLLAWLGALQEDLGPRSSRRAAADQGANGGSGSGSDEEAAGGRKAGGRAGRAAGRAAGAGPGRPKGGGGGGAEPGPPVDGAALRVDEWLLDVDENGVPLVKVRPPTVRMLMGGHVPVPAA